MDQLSWFGKARQNRKILIGLEWRENVVFTE
jgi:hypothetical protein